MKITPAQQEVIRMARSLIRDMAMNWARDELAADPEEVCKQLSKMIGEEYDFEKGEGKSKKGEEKSNKKLTLFADTIIRKDGAGNLFLMNRKDAGWSSSAIPVPNEDFVLERFRVTLGKWTKDKYGEYCPVHKEEDK